MDKPDRREILSRVAAGTISPEEAASQLDSLGQTEETAEPGIRRVRIARQLGSVEIIGDRSVREAVAEGRHRVRIEGDTMIFEGEGWDEAGGFVFGFARNWATEKLLIRVNPSLALELNLQAGNCRVSGVEGPIHADVQAGSATIDGFRHELHISVQAGSLKASGILDQGDSRITCDAGSVNLMLERGSSVRIQARASMGKVELPGAIRVNPRSSRQEVQLGEGAGLLRIDTNMGSVRVAAQ